MQHEIPFSVTYLTDDHVPIRDVIDSLLGIETVLQEVAGHIPWIVQGIEVDRADVSIRSISQESPLRELIAFTLFVTFQEDLESEVPKIVEGITGYPVPENLDTAVTLLALIIVFYGVGLIKDFVSSKIENGPAQTKFKDLVSELSALTGHSEQSIEDRLNRRYEKPGQFKKLANMTSRFFRPSKRQSSAAIKVNNRDLSREIIRDIPDDFEFEEVIEGEPSRSFSNVKLELHAQDRDHAGKGWAALIPDVIDQRVRLQLMDEVSPDELWGKDHVLGDVTVIYQKTPNGLIPKKIHLHRINN